MHRLLVGGSCATWVRAASSSNKLLRRVLDSGEVRGGAAVNLHWARGGRSKFTRCRRHWLRALCGGWALLRHAARRACHPIWQRSPQSAPSCKLQRSRVYFTCALARQRNFRVVLLQRRRVHTLGLALCPQGRGRRHSDITSARTVAAPTQSTSAPQRLHAAIGECIVEAAPCSAYRSHSRAMRYSRFSYKIPLCRLRAQRLMYFSCAGTRGIAPRGRFEIACDICWCQ